MASLSPNPIIRHSLFLRTVCRHHLDYILISGYPQCSTLLIFSTCPKRQRVPGSKAWHPGSLQGIHSAPIVLTFNKPLHASASGGGSPEIGVPSSVFCRGSTSKQGELSQCKLTIRNTKGQINPWNQKPKLNRHFHQHGGRYQCKMCWFFNVILALAYA